MKYCVAWQDKQISNWQLKIICSETRAQTWRKERTVGLNILYFVSYKCLQLFHMHFLQTREDIQPMYEKCLRGESGIILSDYNRCQASVGKVGGGMVGGLRVSELIRRRWPSARCSAVACVDWLRGGRALIGRGT